MVWTEERAYPDWSQKIRTCSILVEQQTRYQHVLIVRSQRFGNILLLDSVIQLSEADEFIYHEMMVHVPLLMLGDVRRVLIIGGGDGGCLRELVRYPSIDRIVMVELDRQVIALSRAFLPQVSNGAFEDPRLELCIGDGARYVESTQDIFDLIIIDSTDAPKQGEIPNPGSQLFKPAFYRCCRNLLSARGLMVCQGGIAWPERLMLVEILQNLASVFGTVVPYTAVIPTFLGGMQVFPLAGERVPVFSEEELTQRLEDSGVKLRHYTPAIHKAAFVMPPWFTAEVASHG